MTAYAPAAFMLSNIQTAGENRRTSGDRCPGIDYADPRIAGMNNLPAIAVTAAAKAYRRKRNAFPAGGARDAALFAPDAEGKLSPTF